jgi:hypothetical protein
VVQAQVRREEVSRRGQVVSAGQRAAASSRMMVDRRVAAAAGRNNRIMASLRDLASKYLLCTTPVRLL